MFRPNLLTARTNFRVFFHLKLLTALLQGYRSTKGLPAYPPAWSKVDSEFSVFSVFQNLTIFLTSYAQVNISSTNLPNPNPPSYPLLYTIIATLNKYPNPSLDP